MHVRNGYQQKIATYRILNSLRELDVAAELFRVCERRGVQSVRLHHARLMMGTIGTAERVGPLTEKSSVET